MTEEIVSLREDEKRFNLLSQKLVIRKEIIDGQRCIEILDGRGSSLLSLGAHSAHLFAVALFGACEDRDDPIPEKIGPNVLFEPGDLVSYGYVQGLYEYGDERGYLVWRTAGQWVRPGTIRLTRGPGMSLIDVSISDVRLIKKRYRPMKWFGR